MNIPVSDGSENIITPPEEWKSTNKWTSSEDSFPRTVGNAPLHHLMAKDKLKMMMKRRMKMKVKARRRRKMTMRTSTMRTRMTTTSDHLGPLACFLSLFAVKLKIRSH
jgi:transcription initiation factor TFIIIB Brf1 subunit/transcription initiation factor TFIIB